MDLEATRGDESRDSSLDIQSFTLLEHDDDDDDSKSLTFCMAKEILMKT